MWARFIEILLGIWLAAGPYIFGRGEAGAQGFANDLVCGVAVIVLALLSFSGRFGWAHFLILFVAAWLVVIGYLAGYPSPPAAQNHIIVGILLAMFAIIPNRINEIPESWQAFYSGKSNENIDKGGKL